MLDMSTTSLASCCDTSVTWSTVESQRVSESPHHHHLNSNALLDSKSSGSSLNVTPIMVEKGILEVNQSLKELSFESTTSKGDVNLTSALSMIRKSAIRSVGDKGILIWRLSMGIIVFTPQEGGVLS